MQTLRCTSCGASLHVNEKTRILKCDYCHSTMVFDNALEFANVSEEEASKVRRLRENLKDSVSKNNIVEMKRSSNLIRDLIPNDFTSNYYYAFALDQEGSSNNLYEFYESSIEATKYEIDNVISHIIHFGELRDKHKILDFLENYDNSRIEEYLKEFELRKDRLDYYDSSIKRDVFVCHRSTDIETVERIVDEIEKDGYECWVSYRNLRPNDSKNYWKSIEEAIENCQLFMCVSSESSMLSKDVQQEVKLSVRKNKQRIEYKIDDARQTRLFKDSFDGRQWVEGKYDKNFTNLLDRVHVELNNKRRIIELPKKRYWLYSLILPIAIIGYLLIGNIANTTETEQPIETEFGVDTVAPNIQLIGESEITIEKGTYYSDKGATCSDLVSQCEIETSGRVDYSQVGVYEIQYQASDFSENKSEVLTRVVSVVDTTKPEVTSKDTLELAPKQTEIDFIVRSNEYIKEYSIDGATFISLDYLSKEVTVSLEKGEHSVVVKDLSDNLSVEHIVNVTTDTIKPVILSDNTGKVYDIERLYTFSLETDELIYAYSTDNGETFKEINQSKSLDIELGIGEYKIVVKDLYDNISNPFDVSITLGVSELLDSRIEISQAEVKGLMMELLDGDTYPELVVGNSQYVSFMQSYSNRPDRGFIAQSSLSTIQVQNIFDDDVRFNTIIIDDGNINISNFSKVPDLDKITEDGIHVIQYGETKIVYFRAYEKPFIMLIDELYNGNVDTEMSLYEVADDIPLYLFSDRQANVNTGIVPTINKTQNQVISMGDDSYDYKPVRMSSGYGFTSVEIAKNGNDYFIKLKYYQIENSESKVSLWNQSSSLYDFPRVTNSIGWQTMIVKVDKDLFAQYNATRVWIGVYSLNNSYNNITSALIDLTEFN